THLCIISGAPVSVIVGCYRYTGDLRTTLNWFGLGYTQLHVFPTSFLFSPGDDSLYRRVGGHTTNRTADTTAVVLNWSRFQNVVEITALFCDPSLEHTLHTVVVWNNNPKPLSKSDFSECIRERLSIINSPSNEYFKARFTACAQASTPYCFIQDDDYFVLPEVIISMLDTADPVVHTSVAWLGHGAMFPRSLAVDFLALMQHLNMTDVEQKMADNYFSIMRNVVPRPWRGQAFTVGTEGDERNKKHFIRATEFLQSVLDCQDSDCSEIPFVDTSLGSVHVGYRPSRSVCRGVPCILETSISNLPTEALELQASSLQQILTKEDEFMLKTPHHILQHYLDHPLSRAVDGLPNTAFQSLYKGSQGDFITLDTLEPLGAEWYNVELVALVDAGTAQIFQQSNFQMRSHDSDEPVATSSTVRCSSVRSSLFSVWHNLKECSVQMLSGDSIVDPSARLFSVRLEHDVDVRWRIYEIWMRGVYST
ncbi:hypothetical protein BDZ89DRAFT_1060209, partial [Hymenopellis radicata]